MKRIYFAALILTVFISCNTKQSDEKVTDKDSTVLNNLTDSGSLKTDAHYLWSADLAPKKGVIMKRLRPVVTDSLTPANILQLLNETYPEIPLRVTKLSNDTIFVKINNSNYLTQQMGSSGPEVYLADVTYNLTEIPGINFVAIVFKAGDHASPDIYSRTDFVK
jgi:hypothetical protein